MNHSIKVPIFYPQLSVASVKRLRKYYAMWSVSRVCVCVWHNPIARSTSALPSSLQKTKSVDSLLFQIAIITSTYIYSTFQRFISFSSELILRFLCRHFVRAFHTGCWRHCFSLGNWEWKSSISIQSNRSLLNGGRALCAHSDAMTHSYTQFQTTMQCSLPGHYGRTTGRGRENTRKKKWNKQHTK